MDERRGGGPSRRSGAIFLALVSATNVVVWLEPISRARIAGDLASASEIRLGLLSCLLAVGLDMAAWVWGRRPRAAQTENSKGRRYGLQLSILSAALNLGLAAGILFRAPHFTGPSSLLTVVAAVWYLLLLPLQIAAAYWSGRGTLLERRRAPAVAAPAAQ
jgi:hypothetical protein